MERLLTRHPRPFSPQQIIDAIQQDSQLNLPELRAGVARIHLLMQLQADILGFQ